MEQLFADTFASSLTVELLELLLYCSVLSWLARVQICYVRCLPSLHSCAEFIAQVFRIQEDGTEEKAPEGRKMTVPGQTEEDFGLCREDVEMVMESLGIGCSGGDEQFKEVAVADDLNCLFEAEEPSLEEVKEAFGVFDRNGDGFIDADELQRVLSILGFKEVSAAGDCQQMIAKYDENRDGMIDLHEFVTLMECSFS